MLHLSRAYHLQRAHSGTEADHHFVRGSQYTELSETMLVEVTCQPGALRFDARGWKVPRSHGYRQLEDIAEESPQDQRQNVQTQAQTRGSGGTLGLGL